MPTAEKPVQKRYFLLQHGKKHADGQPWEDYKHYVNTTSILFPLPPALYARLPMFVKRYILLDLPMYQFDESKDGESALKEEKESAWKQSFVLHTL